MFARKKKPAQPLSPDEALQKLEHFCAYQERSPQEVRDKLKELGQEGEAAEQLYQVLESDGFFDAARFAGSYVRGKFRFNHWGRIRIRQMLRQKGIAPAQVEAALREIDETEYKQLLHQLWEKKMREYAGDEKARDKSMAALLRAGFEPELVFGLNNR